MKINFGNAKKFGASKNMTQLLSIIVEIQFYSVTISVIQLKSRIE